MVRRRCASVSGSIGRVLSGRPARRPDGTRFPSMAALGAFPDTLVVERFECDAGQPLCGIGRALP